MPRKVKKSTSKKPINKNKTLKSMLHSKMMLYLALTLFLFNIIAFLFYKDMQSLFLFVIILSITYLFDQNMIVVLTTPILIVGLLIFLRKSFMTQSVVEGFKETHNPEANEKKEDEDKKDEDKEDDDEEDKKEK